MALFWPFVDGKVIYVDDATTGTNDGTSWSNACLCLQNALAAARSGDEIHVAQGVYKPSEGLAAIPEFGWRATTFQLINGVTLQGGYAGFGAPDPNVRDIGLYRIILSGDLDEDDWITSFEGQEAVYPFVLETIELLESLM